jgi:hypothetical protein
MGKFGYGHAFYYPYLFRILTTEPTENTEEPSNELFKKLPLFKWVVFSLWALWALW